VGAVPVVFGVVETAAVAVEGEEGGTAVAEGLPTEEVTRDCDDFSKSSRCCERDGDDDVVVAEVETRRSRCWEFGAETTISAGGGATEKASDDAVNSSREATDKRNMWVGILATFLLA